MNSILKYKSIYILNTFVIICTFLNFTACKKQEAEPLETENVVIEEKVDNCQGEPLRVKGNRSYYQEETVYDDIGAKSRFLYYKLEGDDFCTKINISLSNYESRIRKRARQGIECEPQEELAQEVYLRAANNYYTYRNNRHFLHLNPFTGEYRSITFGEDKESGRIIHAKKEGCFWMRKDLEDEPWGSTDYGLQIFFDVGAGSETALYNAIYKLNVSGADWQFTGNDQISDWGYAFCPYLSTPWNFCEMLRNGNIMYFPSLSTDQKNILLAEALLIRTQNNFIEIDEYEFEDKWKIAMSRDGEVSYWSSIYNFDHIPQFKYRVIFSPDAPLFTQQAWIEYIKGIRPVMPDVNSISQRPICYNTFKEVILDDGSSSYIQGEVCYVNGVYTFTQF